MEHRCLTEGVYILYHLEVGDLYVHIKYSSSAGLGGCAPPTLEGYD